MNTGLLPHAGSHHQPADNILRKGTVPFMAEMVKTTRRVQHPPSTLYWKKLLVLLVFIGGFATFFAIGGEHYLNMQTLKTHQALLYQYTQQHYLRMLVIMGVTYTLVVAFSIPAGAILSIICGFLFGDLVGTVLVVLTATLGATIIFLATRYVFADLMRARFGHYLEHYLANIEKDEFDYMLFLRLVPFFPFWLANIVPAFTPIKVRSYIAATLLGVIPGSFVFVNLGRSLGRIEATGLLSYDMTFAMLLLAAFSIIPLLIRKFKLKKSRGR